MMVAFRLIDFLEDIFHQETCTQLIFSLNSMTCTITYTLKKISLTVQLKQLKEKQKIFSFSSLESSFRIKCWKRQLGFHKEVKVAHWTGI